ncbi:MAG TPA: hypothetical protein VHG91_18530 [Longimicrobium sp.]|nr:hypothetical protein [Longimicrobium sp.]
MRLLAPLLLVLAAACATAGAPSDTPLAGRYTLAAVDGRPLPTESPTESGVTLEGGSLLLTAGARYTLELVARLPGLAAQTATVHGGYTVRGDTLLLAADGMTRFGPSRYLLVRDGRALRIRDDRGKVYAFTRG